MQLFLELCLTSVRICIMKLQNGSTLTIDIRDGKYFSIALAFILAGAVDQKGVEKYYIAFFHLEIDSMGWELVVLLDSEIGFINLSIPLRVNMLIKFIFMSLRHNIQWSVLLGCILKRRPSSHYFLSGTKWKISEILMKRMSWTAAHTWRFVYKHCVDWFYVVSAETFQIRDYVWICAVSLQNIVSFKILDFCDWGLSK